MNLLEIRDDLLRENAASGGSRYPTYDSIFKEFILRVLERDKHEHHPTET